MSDTARDGSSRTRHAAKLFAELGDRYERMGALLSFGEDPRWRRFLVSRVPPVGRVLDVATGTGLVARELVGTGRARAVVGLDPSEGMLRHAVGRSDPETIAFVLGRAESLPFGDAVFDALTVTYLLRYVDDPAATLGELARVVRPGGVIASLEFGVPPNPVWRACWWSYTRFVMPAVGGVVSRDWYRVGRFLGPSIEGFWRRYPLEEQLELWRAAGIDRIRWRRMSLGGGVVLWGVRRA
jgi:demethylmenaquinone methyltransferase / 2-methoxy-6-polyprenyl-1,4-benzoquinol methylase